MKRERETHVERDMVEEREREKRERDMRRERDMCEER